MFYSCEICDKVFGRKWLLTRHVRSIHERKRLTCGLCAAVFKRVDNLKVHLRVKHDTTEKQEVSDNIFYNDVVPSTILGGQPRCVKEVGRKFVCGLCAHAAYAIDDLHRHLRDIHNINEFAEDYVFECGNTPPSEGVLFDDERPSTSRAGVRRRLDDDEQPSTSAASKKKRPTTIKHCTACNEGVEERNWVHHQRKSSHKLKLKQKLDKNVSFIRSAFSNRVVTYSVANENEGNLDVGLFFQENREIIQELIISQLNTLKSIKFNIEVHGDFVKNCLDEDGMLVEVKSMQTKMHVLLRELELDEILTIMFDDIAAKLEEFQEKDSGWALLSFNRIDININKYQPLRGSVYFPLPKYISNKHACINVQNNDEYCFKWAIIAALSNIESCNRQRSSKYMIPNIAAEVIAVDDHSLDFSNMEFPLKIADVAIFEENNNISINVFGYESSGKEDGELQIVGPYYHTAEEKETHINLLFCEQGAKTHYVYIKNISRLLRSQQTSCTRKTTICNGCLQRFKDSECLKEHKPECKKVVTVLPDEDNNILEFKNHEKKLTVPFVVYADFEAILSPINSCKPNPNASSTSDVQVHIPCAFSYIIKCSYDDKLNKRRTYVGAAVLFGAKKDDALKEIRESLQFEMDLAAISLAKEQRRNFTLMHNLRTVRMLQVAYPYINWKEYINALLQESLQIDDDETINVSTPAFFEKLGSLLAKTPNRTIANYLMSRVYLSSIPFLSDEFKRLHLQYVSARSGKKENEPRWKKCVDINTSGLGIAIGSLYVRKYFNEESKQIASEMVNDMRSTFGNTLRQVNWMDEKTRKSALEKLDAITAHVGYPDELIQNDKLDKFYENLDLDPSKYLESCLKMVLFGSNKVYNKLRLPVNKTDWVEHATPAMADAYYSLQENSIQFPAGILQEKFFNAHRPKYMNYAAIGSFIAHEITHGFDDQGSQFDLNGNLIDWWQQDTKLAYLAKARCIINQYGNYTDKLTGLNLNGVNTQGENIADNGGVKDSYLAYKTWSKTYGPEPKLPGLDFSPEQMFWIAAAQNWCIKITKKYQEVSITTDPHSPFEYRVLGPIVNMKEFAKDFQCPVGSRMNPVNKCEVW